MYIEEMRVGSASAIFVALSSARSAVPLSQAR